MSHIISNNKLILWHIFCHLAYSSSNMESFYVALCLPWKWFVQLPSLLYDVLVESMRVGTWYRVNWWRLWNWFDALVGWSKFSVQIVQIIICVNYAAWGLIISLWWDTDETFHIFVTKFWIRVLSFMVSEKQTRKLT